MEQKEKKAKKERREIPEKRNNDEDCINWFHHYFEKLMDKIIKGRKEK